MIPVSVSLSGSGFRLSCHIGALQALIDNDFEIKELSATSGGSIVAALFAAGYTPEQMLNLAHNTQFKSFIKYSISNMIWYHYFDNGDVLYNWLKAQLATKTFNDLKLPTNIISTDLNQASSFVFNQNNTLDMAVAFACRASCSIPFIFKPVEFSGKYLVDGGLSDDLPVNYLSSDSLKVAIELFETTPPLKGVVPFQDFLSKMIDTVIDATSDGYLGNGVTVVSVETLPGLSLNTNITRAQIDQLYSLGYNATSTAIKNIGSK